MKNLFDATVVREVISRINQLSGESIPLWGKMDVAQMLAHATRPMRLARGLDRPSRRFIGVVLGWLVKKSFLGEKPLGKNSPTDPSLIVADARNFEEEKKILVEHINAFFEGGPAKCTTHPNPFFGKLTPDEWARLQYRHIDHHLTQFGV